MASEAVKKILAAEAESDKKTADARRKAEDIVNEAQRQASLAVQKKLTEARSETEKIRSADQKRAEEYRTKAEKENSQELERIRKKAESNYDKAAKAIISEFFG